jgi:hypothetical protein
MKRIATLIAVTGLVAASGFVLADGPTQTVDVKAPIRLSAAQMDKIVAGAPPTLQSPGTSDNSCNSGKCYYTNENDKVIGKPVKGFNN